MRNPLGGPVATLLMFVPLLAIPLFAVFGTPQMSSTGSPAAQVEELKFAVEKDKSQTGNSLPDADLVSAVQISDGSAGTPNGAGQNAAQPAAPAAASVASVAKNEADPFADFVRPADGDKPRSDAPAGNADDANRARQPKKTALASNDPVADDGRAARPDRDPAATNPNAGNPPGEPAAERTRSKSATKLTAGFDADRSAEPSQDAKGIRAGIARLNALGITDYQWQPGDHDGEFLFRCRLVSRHNPRMMQRFEAEAGEPLQALEKVLAQIDEWRARRTGRDVRTSVGEAPANATVMAPRNESLPAAALDVSNR